MESKRLSQYIHSLSMEDRETYKALIDDALRRDMRLAEVVYQAKKRVEMFETDSLRLQETTARFHESISRLNEKLAGIAEVSNGALREMPFGSTAGGYSNLRH